MTTAARALSAVMKVVGGLLALVLVVYLAVNLAGLARGWHQRNQLADDFTEQARELLPELRDQQAAVAAEAGREPERAWIEQVCSFGHDDSGWMINNYREQCSVRAVSAWRVESLATGRSLLRVTPPDYPIHDPTCEELGTLRDGSGNVSLALAGRDADSRCEDATSYGTETRTIDGDSEPLPTDATWVVVADDTGNLVDADIGCTHWSLLFCDNPFTDHAWAELG